MIAGRDGDWCRWAFSRRGSPRDAVVATGKGARRRGDKLPPHMVVYLVMALALFADQDYEKVVERLTGGAAVVGS
jgi:hypothetical protein